MRDEGLSAIDRELRELANCLVGLPTESGRNAAKIREAVADILCDPFNVTTTLYTYLWQKKSDTDPAVKERANFLAELVYKDPDLTALNIFIDIFHLYDLSDTSKDSKRLADAKSDFRRLGENPVLQRDFIEYLRRTWNLARQHDARITLEENKSGKPRGLLMAEKFELLVDLRKRQQENFVAARRNSDNSSPSIGF